MNKTSNGIVSEYLNSLLMDQLAVPEAIVETEVIEPFQSQDSVGTGQRVVRCMDPFKFMDVAKSHSDSQLFLVFILLLTLNKALPESRLKQYCLRQCQILLTHLKLSIQV